MEKEIQKMSKKRKINSKFSPITYYLRILIIDFIGLSIAIKRFGNRLSIEGCGSFRKSFSFKTVTSEIIRRIFGYFIEDFQRKCFLIVRNIEIASNNSRYKRLFYLLPKKNSISLKCWLWNIKTFPKFNNEIFFSNVHELYVYGRCNMLCLLEKVKNLKKIVIYEIKKLDYKEIVKINPLIEEIYNFRVVDQKGLNLLLDL